MNFYADNVIDTSGEGWNLNNDYTRGNWVYKPLQICNATTFAKGTHTSFPLDNYLPNDGWDYEILGYFIGNTVATAHQPIYMWVRNGTVNNYNIACRSMSVCNRNGASENGAGTFILPIRSSCKYLGIYNESGATLSGNCYSNLVAYRRLGRNNLPIGTEHSPQHKIQDSQGNNIFIGAPLPGKWVSNRVTLLDSYNFPARVDVNGVQTYTDVNIDFSGCIPNDGYTYEAIIDGTITTSATNGQYASLRVAFPYTTNFVCVAESLTRSGASKCNYFNFRYPLYPNQRYLTFHNTGTSICTTNLRFEAYRRIGIYE